MAHSPIRFTPGEVAAYYAARVPHLKQRRAAEWRGPCPIHHGTNDNFAVNAATGEAHCFSQCGRGWDILALEQALTGADFKTAKAEVFRLVGRIEPEARHNGARTNGNSAGAWREVARYGYVDREGKLLYEVVRQERGEGVKREKKFLQRRPNGKGGWIWNLNGVTRVPYRLPSVLKAETVVLVEGEKDVQTLEQWLLPLCPGVAASCNPGGSSSSYLYAEWAEYFAGKQIIVLPDNDAPGRKHAAATAAALLGVADWVCIVELPGLPAKGDVTDWRDAGNSAEHFLEIATAAAPLDTTALAELRTRWGLDDKELDREEHTETGGEWPRPEPILRELPAAESPYDDESGPTQSNWPDELKPEAFHGVAGELVHLIGPHSEADPAALLVQLLVGFGNVIGRQPHFVAEADKHFTNLFAVIVGQTAKGRKGTAWGQIQRILAGVDAAWSNDRIMGGLASGEGLIWAVRDEIRERSPVRDKGRIVRYEDVVSDAGEDDKRLLVVEPEFARVLQVAERESNTLSAIIRQAWDTGNLRILTKRQAARSTEAHISIIGHITKDELRRLLTDTAAGNGFANRFLWVCARRSKLLPEGGALHTVDFASIVRRVQSAADFARGVEALRRDDKARAIWFEVYSNLSEGKPGMLGAVTSRAEAQVMRLACVYALLDCSELIQAEHLMAALAVWQYCEASARFIFGDSLGDATADEILRELRNHPQGMTRSEIREHFSRNKSAAEIGRAVGVLQEYGLARMERRREQEGQTRPTERWFAITLVRG
jgi:hypothetical protein